MRTDLAATLLLLTVVLAAVGAARARGAARPRAVTAFILAVASAGFIATGVQWELYPFSAWPLVAGTVPDSFTVPRVMLVDAAGAEHDLDSRAVRPIPFAEFASWMDLRFPTLPRATQDSAAAWIVAHADSVRASARAGRAPHEFGVLGVAGAPFFLLHPRRWDDARAVPALPFVGLRLYRERWKVEHVREGVRRQLRYAWPATDTSVVTATLAPPAARPTP